MSIFKCKMCGGALEINNNETVATCEYCGTQQTLPKLEDDRRANLYDRANHFRRNNEFDKAMGIYEQILNEDNTDAEAYWSLVLCRFGIEYVEDPSSHKRIPTVNRAQFTSIFDDDNYKSALEYADGYQKTIYEEEANTINEIQKGILAISQKEEPFDIFICYKETDNNGRRTPDSVLAQDLYYQLKQEGFKVFFSRITLEDKLGTAYEPYIFAALNSSKVMVVLGTRQEYFNAVWVKNEWSRYLTLIKNGATKMLIPAYKDMDPYDLPEEFSHLQAQDMSKLGFMQDLIRGIKKIVKASEPQEAVVRETVVSASNMNIDPLLKRAFMFLEDGDWRSADEYCEKVLDMDPECARAYLGKLMAELRVRNENLLCHCKEPFDGHDNYNKVCRFADDKLREKLKNDIEHINTRNENERLEGLYIKASNVLCNAKTVADYSNASDIFKSISEYKDSASLAEQCDEKAEITRKDDVLTFAYSKMKGSFIPDYQEAIRQLKTISGWKDADETISVCERKIEEIKQKNEADRLERKRQAEIKRKEAEDAARKKKKIIITVSSVICAVVAFVILLNTVILPPINRSNAYKVYGETLSNLKVGDVFEFGTGGSYSMNVNANGKMEWIVLEVKDGKAFVVSKYLLEKQPYHKSGEATYWENCDLRKWLNKEFFGKGFTSAERSIICDTYLEDTKTNDKIFLLNEKEAKEVYKTGKLEIIQTSREYEVDGNWWLRNNPKRGATLTMNSNGRISLTLVAVRVPVRPAMWIKLK